MADDNEKRRIEAKINATRTEAREFTRDRLDELRKELHSDISRLDYRMTGLERLVWNRVFVFIAGFCAGGVLVGLLFLGLQ